MAQTLDAAGTTSWDRVLRPHVGDRWQLARLSVNYRTPAEVMDAAADLLADGRLAVIVPDDRAAAVRARLPDAAAGPQPDLTARVVVLGVRQAKGLEFDSVLIADPAAILAASPRGRNDLYVALTRTTDRLGVLHPGPAPDEIAQALHRRA